MIDKRSDDPYLNPNIAIWMDSFEGVPNIIWPSPSESAAEQAARLSWQQWLYVHFDDIGALLPGLCLAFLLAISGKALAKWIGIDLLHFERSPISGIFCAIILGLLIRNTIGLPQIYSAGISLCLKGILRIGVVMLGIRLSFVEIGILGMRAIPIIIGCVAAALILVGIVGRAMKLPARLSSLIAVGTSICGVSAIAATGPAIDAEEDEISYAVATIALFGMIALLLYPFIAHLIFADHPELAGIFLGTAVHDTAQVAGSALMYEQQYGAPTALSSAVVTKLIRNLSMIIVIPLIALKYHRNTTGRAARPKLSKLLPLFVFGFVSMSAFRSIGDLGVHAFRLFSANTWHHLIDLIDSAADWCLILAMSAIGLSTSISKLKILGLRPFLTGCIAAILVGLTSVFLIKILSLWWT